MLISVESFSSAVGVVSKVFLFLSLICILPAACAVLFDLGLWVVEALRGRRSQAAQDEREDSSRLLANEKEKDEEGFRDTEAATKEDIDDDDGHVRRRNNLEKDW
ncbi:hypothetical protein BJ508DRAFT_413150 [Ascobolus immersus RN42]|uniref:Transmembrane protein n=1 Tax=Ascobolus immersus RN42 TaxID=1160509 RepID=A0A3N4ICI1_ASCIM|nr:hypothetical protein BJ508DRAFT_413150 [Ascobolus immersus RN42]